MPPVVGQTYNTWEAILAYLDTPTADGRQLASEGMTVRDLPLTLLFMPATDDGHDGAYPMGRVDKIWVDGNKLMGSGIVDSSPEAQEAARMIADGIQREISIDPIPTTYTYRFPLDYNEEIIETEEGGEAVQVTETNSDYLVVFQEWQLGGVTVVSGAAFADTAIEITADALANPAPVYMAGSEIRINTGFTAAALDDPDGAFIALFPDDPTGLAVDGGETAENLHVTLIAGIGADTDAAALDALVQDLAANIAPLTGTIGGAGMFGASDQGTPVILLPDVPQLSDVQQAIDDTLDAAQITFSEDHGYVPHITVAYAQDGDTMALPTDRIGTAVNFSTLSVVNGDQREDYPLAGASDEEEDVEGATASAAGLVPEHPPVEWFEDPGLSEPTPMHFGEDGRVYGHAALFGVCHTGLSGRCLSLEQLRSNAAYAYFHTGYIVTESGEKMRTGVITIGTDHPSTGLRDPQVVAQHYANTGTAAADVRVGEDEHGLWVAGAIRPEFPANRLRELRGACLSGDWRPINRAAELMALLAVNVPGFPIVAPEALVASGASESDAPPLAAVAVGMTLPGDFDARDEARGEQRLAALRAAGGGLDSLREAAGLPA